MGENDIGRAMAESAAAGTAIDVQDAMVLIGWLHQRIVALEGLLAEIPPPAPDRPSRMHGFACIPRRQSAISAALTDIYPRNTP